jgi:hypothetical protein
MIGYQEASTFLDDGRVSDRLAVESPPLSRMAPRGRKEETASFGAVSGRLFVWRQASVT